MSIRCQWLPMGSGRSAWQVLARCAGGSVFSSGPLHWFLVLHWSYRLEPGSAAPFLPAGLYENHLQVSAQILLSPFGVGIGSLTKTMRGNDICLMAFALRHEQVKLVLTAYHSLSYRHPRSSTVQPKLLSGPRSDIPLVRGVFGVRRTCGHCSMDLRDGEVPNCRQ